MWDIDLFFNRFFDVSNLIKIFLVKIVNMKSKYIFLIAFSLAAASCSPKLSGIQKISGNLVPLEKNTVIAFFSPTCELNTQAIGAFTELSTLYYDKFAFAFVLNNEKHKFEEMHEFVNNHQLYYWKAYFDIEGKYAKMNKVKQTPYIFVVDKNGNVLYQGAGTNINAELKANDKIEYYLIDAIKAIDKGDKAPLKQTPVKGCPLD